MSQEAIRGRVAALPTTAPRPAEQASSLLRTWWLPLSLTLVALALRVYGMEVIAYMPDSYEQLDATVRLLHLDFPLSRIYAPGIAVLMAPFLAVLGTNLGALQAVIIGFGVAMVPLAYLAMLRLTGDRLAAALLAFALAVDPSFVFKARVSHYDTITTLLIAVALYLVPSLRRTSWVGLLCYGFLLSIILNTRPLNFVVLPALLIYWLGTEPGRQGLSGYTRSLFSPRVLTVFGTLAVLSLVYAVLGGWFGQANGASLTFERFWGNALHYELLVLGSMPVLLIVAPLAFAGARRLWRTQPALTAAMLYVILAWPWLHAPFFWSNGRYMMPATLLVYALAALGASESWAWVSRQAGRRRVYVRFGLASALLALGALFVGPSLVFLGDWSASAQRTQGELRAYRPVLAGYDPTTTLVTAMARGLRDANRDVRYLDLIDHFVANGSGPASAEALSSSLRDELAAGRSVLYLRTEWEDGVDFQGGGKDGFQRFFEAVERDFELTPVLTVPKSDPHGYDWTLYRVSLRP